VTAALGLVGFAPHVVVFVSAIAATLTGYGFVVLSAPLLALMFPAAQVVPLTLALGWVLTSAVLARPAGYRSVVLAEAVPLAAAGLVGVPLGAVLLDVLSQHTLRVVLGVGVAASALMPLLSPRLPVPFAPRPRLARYAAGFASGVLSGCVGLNGPPVALYLALRGAPKDQARATAAAVVWLLSTATLAYYAATAHLPPGVTPWTLALLPALALGWIAGSFLFRAISVTRFKQVSLTYAAVAGVVTALAGLRG
jgi:uncharacterized membrane protein YfcA